MTDRNAVRDILYRAGVEGTPNGSEHAFSSATHGLAVILRQLEDGVLPRLFDLRFDGGGRLVLEVAERQVLGVADMTFPEPGGKAAPVSQGPLSADDAKALGEALSALCRGSKRVQIATRPDPAIAVGAGGISVGALRRASGVPEMAARASGQVTWLDAVVDHQDVNILSAVLIDVDEAHVIIGSKEQAEALADWAVEMLDVFLADGFPLAPELETKGAVTFAPQQNGCHILLAGLRGQFLLALVSGPDTGASLSVWQSIADREIDGFLPAA